MSSWLNKQTRLHPEREKTKVQSKSASVTTLGSGLLLFLTDADAS